MKIFKLINTIYLFDINRSTIMTYQLEPEGFFYSFCKFIPSLFTHRLDLIINDIRSEEMTIETFTEFASVLSDIQNLEERLVSVPEPKALFENLAVKYNLKMKKQH